MGCFLFGEFGDDIISKDAVWLVSRPHLLFECLQPLGSTVGICQFDFGLPDSLREVGIEGALPRRDVIRVFVLRVVGNDFLSEARAEIGLTVVVNSSIEVDDGVLEGYFCHRCGIILM